MSPWIKKKIENHRFSEETLIPLLKGVTFLVLFGVLQIAFYFFFLKKVIKPEDLFTLNITIPNLIQLLYSEVFILLEFIVLLLLIFSHKLKLWALDQTIKILTKLNINNAILRLKELFTKRQRELNTTITAIKYFNRMNSEDKFDIYNLLDVLDKIGVVKIYSLKTDKFTFNQCYDKLIYSCRESEYLYISGISQYEFLGKYSNVTDEVKNLFNILEINPEIEIKMMLLNPNGDRADDYIKFRISQIGKVMRIDEYKEEIRRTVEKINEIKQRGYNIDYKLYNDKPLFRYYITGSLLFLTHYINNCEGHESTIIEYNDNSRSMYYSYRQLFLERWNRF